MIFTVGSLYSQSNPTTKHADLMLGQDEEDLSVFHHWIRWNNPGSMLINYLTKLENGYYTSRDSEIARLKTRVDWIRRHKVIKGKLMDLVGPFPERTPLNRELQDNKKKWI